MLVVAAARDLIASRDDSPAEVKLRDDADALITAVLKATERERLRRYAASRRLRERYQRARRDYPSLLFHLEGTADGLKRSGLGGDAQAPAEDSVRVFLREHQYVETICNTEDVTMLVRSAKKGGGARAVALRLVSRGTRVSFERLRRSR